MKKYSEIITVGFNPVWDRTCYVDGIEWSEHKIMASQTCTPAGKALNISKALAWMSVPSVATGLWGIADYPEMLECLSGSEDYVQPAFTIVQGHSRQNVTIIDTLKKRELHLRSGETLITSETLGQLENNLSKWIHPQTTIIFAGSIINGPILDECVGLIQRTSCKCASLVVDTSGKALSKIVDTGQISLIKPNHVELCELLGRSVDNNVEAVISAARQLCDRVKTILVSLGADGAVAITKDTAVHVRAATQKGSVISTVGCGDYLLGGFLSVDPTADLMTKLTLGIKAATAKAIGLIEAKSWQCVQQDIEVDIVIY